MSGTLVVDDDGVAGTLAMVSIIADERQRCLGPNSALLGLSKAIQEPNAGQERQLDSR
jgi:hypothetical protein